MDENQPILAQSIFVILCVLVYIFLVCAKEGVLDYTWLDSTDYPEYGEWAYEPILGSGNCVDYHGKKSHYEKLNIAIDEYSSRFTQFICDGTKPNNSYEAFYVGTTLLNLLVSTK
ncbi:hypothetical protein A2533_00125 [Candidatus Falkowbacteria bacterium RIFOXYD2_FULL_35_9]|uniref:Uncharacterized protein n=1 Tax=Candidatus Falkowbacteria bacterium RIFOXYC2_FULL_36_12 TaxID=1798002 RepID=A0A1F5T3B9_9BACT|nr:MAG: hypothetical protein A2300_01900 [Candidatus Falkowbacteria bacterium RIFOXYB2_FULL_35_7]OGF33051.1 MAG: hypothetical protein A2223_04125 [Candidatus Falkowbacteria bacterium RIFOXYA2_FULL_35_8]OGF33412.1 MAG: hypothetical protein A2478_01795 [Candidatus Falkowbacteria bacterium RIFOXYC2_FULL_36_12]OGF45778.1 MAG: hypothetical protein A2533_00125 [Candidatus Falkowbacteria bacterium RIFOXYD2_FULL_35_9]